MSGYVKNCTKFKVSLSLWTTQIWMVSPASSIAEVHELHRNAEIGGFQQRDRVLQIVSLLS